MVFIDGIYYDFSGFDHPGGNDIIRLFTKNKKKDITTAYISNHSKPFNHNKYKHLKIGGTLNIRPICYRDYLDLIDLVNRDIPIKKRKAPYYYYLKVFIILSFTLVLTYKQYYNWNLYRGIMLGWIHALIGLNIQHDANHGSISNFPIINIILGYTQNLIGGSRELWIYKHMVKHHVETNNYGLDPDNDGRGILKLNTESPSNKLIKYQWLYGILGLPLFAYEILIVETVECIRNMYVFSFITKIIYIYLHVINPYYQYPCLFRFLLTQIPILFTGGYLAFFFILSHNYIGVMTNSYINLNTVGDIIKSDKWDDRYNNKNVITFLQQQIESSSNVGGRLLCELNGGLNYQIEHHLFPKIHHSHYPDISKIVRKYSRNMNYRYTHFDNIYYNLVSTIMYLWIMGKSN